MKTYLCPLEKCNKIIIREMANTPLNPYHVISSNIWCKILHQENKEVLSNFTGENIKRNTEINSTERKQNNIAQKTPIKDPIVG